MENEFNASEKAFISSLVSNRLGYLQRDVLKWNTKLNKTSDDFTIKAYSDFISADKDIIDLCLSILSKLKSKNEKGKR